MIINALFIQLDGFFPCLIENVWGKAFGDFSFHDGVVSLGGLDDLFIDDTTRDHVDVDVVFLKQDFLVLGGGGVGQAIGSDFEMVVVDVDVGLIVSLCCLTPCRDLETDDADREDRGGDQNLQSTMGCGMFCIAHDALRSSGGAYHD